MVKFNYALDSDNYNVKNALLWGNFNGHVQKAKTGTLGNRVVHAMIAAAELLPIVSQIASLIEFFVVKVFGEKSKNITANTERVTVKTNEQVAGPKFVTPEYTIVTLKDNASVDLATNADALNFENLALLDKDRFTKAWENFPMSPTTTERFQYRYFTSSDNIQYIE